MFRLLGGKRQGPRVGVLQRDFFVLRSIFGTSRTRLIPVVVLLLAGTVPALAGMTIGWRTDGSGIYPKAEPPLEWSPTKNVLWSTTMPYGVAHPVPLGQRVFVCAEPATLLCLDRDSGKILWQKTSSYSELEIAADVREKLKDELAETAELTKKQSSIRKERDTLRRSLDKDKAAKEEINEKMKPFDKQIDEIEKEKKKLTVAVRYTQPGTDGTAGYTAATPVTDGKEIFVVYGNGLTACYDLEGNRKWLKLIEHSNASFAHSGSPILVAGKLLIHYTDLVALDPKTGEEVWRLKHPTSHGTPLATKIGDVDVVVTPRGALVRAEDGKLLAQGGYSSCGSNSPILQDRIVYSVHGSATAVRLPEALAETIKKPDVVWKGNAKGGGYWFSSPVLHDGLFYAASDQGVLTVLDAATGKLVYEENLRMGGSTYPSISLAGPYLYISSDNGTTVVVQPGREYKELGRNKLEPFRSSLVFEGKRVYIRTEKHLYCIGE
jgi:outer membrane protein assembly factor BamB